MKSEIIYVSLLRIGIIAASVVVLFGSSATAGSELRHITRLRVVYSDCEPTDTGCASNDGAAKIQDPEDVCAMLSGMAKESAEHLVVLHLDYGKKVRAVETVAIGGLFRVYAAPRDVFRGAILANSAFLIAVHNHPDGRPEPSDGDKDQYKKLADSGELLGIPVIDSIIISPSGCFSQAKGKIVAKASSVK